MSTSSNMNYLQTFKIPSEVPHHLTCRNLRISRKYHRFVFKLLILHLLNRRAFLLFATQYVHGCPSVHNTIMYRSMYLFSQFVLQNT